jgi:hypothetical protein
LTGPVVIAAVVGAVMKLKRCADGLSNGDGGFFNGPLVHVESDHGNKDGIAASV